MKHVVLFSLEPKLPNDLDHLDVFDYQIYFRYFIEFNLTKFKVRSVIAFEGNDHQFKKYLVSEKLKGTVFKVFNEEEDEKRLLILFIINEIDKIKRSIDYETIKLLDDRITALDKSLETMQANLNTAVRKRQDLTRHKTGLLDKQISRLCQNINPVISKYIRKNGYDSY